MSGVDPTNNTLPYWQQLLAQTDDEGNPVLASADKARGSAAGKAGQTNPTGQAGNAASGSGAANAAGTAAASARSAVGADAAPATGGAATTATSAAAAGVDLAGLFDTSAVSQSQTSSTARSQQALAGHKTLLASPPPLPPGRLRVTPQVAQNYQAMAQDISGAYAKGLPTSTVDSKQVVSQLLAADPNTTAGKAQITSTVGSTVNQLGSILNATNDAAMMAAFLELNVRNQASGKELQANLMNLATQTRNTRIQQSIDERAKQAEQLKKAQEKQKRMGPLMTIFKVLVLVASAVATVMTFGATAPVLAMMGAAMAAGGVIGGAVTGAKNGKGFDLNGFLDGATIALDLIGLKALVTAALKALTKLVTKQVAKSSTSVAAKQGPKTLAQASAAAAPTAANQLSRAQLRVLAKLNQSHNAALQKAAEVAKKIDEAVTKLPNMTAGIAKAGGDSSKALNVLQGATQLLVVAQGVTQQVSDYKYKELTLKAREHEAQAKMYNMLVDDAQNLWDDLQDSISSITKAHDSAVTGSLQMINNHHSAAVRAASIVGG